MERFPLGDSAPPEEKVAELQSALKADDEIDHFMVDENLSELERLTILLKSSELLQQAAAINSLPSVVRSRGRAALDRLAPHLNSVLPKFDVDMKITLATSMATILKESSTSPADTTELLFPVVLANVQAAERKTGEEADAWIATFKAMVPVLDKTTLRTEVAPMAMAKGGNDDNVASRVICCRLIGAIAPHLGSEEIERSHFKKMMALCQDPHYRVRATMCSQLCSIARGISLSLASTRLLDELLELVQDEEMSVRRTALEMVPEMMGFLPQDVVQGRVLPMLRTHMQPLEMDAEMHKCIAGLFGPMIVKVAPGMTDDDYALFFGCFRHLAARKDPETRLQCACNFPAAVLAAGAKSYAAHFHDTFVQMVMDQHVPVRVVVAAQFHEIARLLGKDRAAQYLKKALLNLLQDDALEVKAELLRNMTATIPAMMCQDEAKRAALLEELLAPMSAVQPQLKRSWRNQRSLLKVVAVLADSCSSDKLHDDFLLPVLDCCINGASANAKPAADALAAIFRGLKKEKLRTDVLAKLMSELARGRSVWHRMAFINICEAMLKRFSTRFFKNTLLDLCVELVLDSVPNVRLHLCSLLPSLKQAIRLPEDVERLERLNSAMSNLMTDVDRDVCCAARAVNEQFKKMPVRVQGGAGVLEMNGMAAGHSEFEAQDGAKEDSEADFTLCQEDIEKLRQELEAAGPAGRRGGKPGVGDAGMDSASSTSKHGAASTLRGRGSAGSSTAAGSTAGGGVAGAANRRRPGAGANPAAGGAGAAAPTAVGARASTGGTFGVASRGLIAGGGAAAAGGRGTAAALPSSKAAGGPGHGAGLRLQDKPSAAGVAGRLGSTGPGRIGAGAAGASPLAAGRSGGAGIGSKPGALGRGRGK